MQVEAEIPTVCLLDTGILTGSPIARSLLTAAPSPSWRGLAAPTGLAAAKAVMLAALADKRPTDVALSQYYTHPEVAARLYATFKEHCDTTVVQLVEPSAGTGAFLAVMPAGTLAYDVDPKGAGIQTADFLSVRIPTDRPIATLGNPPFGRNCNMAIPFFNHAASQSKIVAFVVPRTFKKMWLQNKLDPYFHLVREVPVPAKAFLFRGKPYNVPAVFQIWERRSYARERWPEGTVHPDFDFTDPQDAEFAIQRVGANAGRIHRNFKLSEKSHYYIRPNVEGVEAIMAQLDLRSVASNTAGNPSLAMAEIVHLYSEWTGRNGQRRRSES